MSKMKKTIKTTLAVLAIIVAITERAFSYETATLADCNSSDKICDSNKSKPSGNGCISLRSRTRKNWTTSKVYPGGRSALCGSSGKSYDDKDVKFINQ